MRDSAMEIERGRVVYRSDGGLGGTTATALGVELAWRPRSWWTSESTVVVAFAPEARYEFGLSFLYGITRGLREEITLEGPYVLRSRARDGGIHIEAVGEIGRVWREMKRALQADLVRRWEAWVQSQVV